MIDEVIRVTEFWGGEEVDDLPKRSKYFAVNF